jgi:site-specific recombinase XerD
VEIEVDEIRAEQVATFLAGTGPVNRYWRRKYDTIRGLYRYATSRGFADHVPLPATVPKMPERFVPYIYSPDELERLINPAAPDQIGFRKLEPHTLRVVLLLLYGAGLRIGEAVALNLGDVDTPHNERRRATHRVLMRHSSCCAEERAYQTISCNRHSHDCANTRVSAGLTAPAINPVFMT